MWQRRVSSFLIPKVSNISVGVINLGVILIP